MTKVYYTIQVLFFSDEELKSFRISNMDAGAVRAFQEQVCTTGVIHTIEPDVREIILPWRIKQILLYRQERFFKPEELGKPLTNKPKI